VKSEREAREKLERIRQGGDAKYHEKARGDGKLFCRERLALLLDEGSFVEDAAFANSLAGDLPADGVVTGSGRIDGRPVCVMANDSTVKAGSWGKRTVEKILRIQERAERSTTPLVYLVDSAGARITDQIDMFPGRRGAGRIFHNQVRMSGRVPQVCLLFGPSAAGGAYIPAFCDIVVMVEGNASMYLGSPRMVEKVIAQETTLEEMGGARMHCSVSGCGDLLVKTEPEAIAAARAYLSYLPSHCDEEPPRIAPVAPVAGCDDLESWIPPEENKTFDMHRVLERILDAVARPFEKQHVDQVALLQPAYQRRELVGEDLVRSVDTNAGAIELHRVLLVRTVAHDVDDHGVAISAGQGVTLEARRILSNLQGRTERSSDICDDVRAALERLVLGAEQI
jgi:acetyl-CoA carboxylase carboxyltransferase component